MKINLNDTFFYFILFSLLPIVFVGQIDFLTYITYFIKIVTVCFGSIILLKKALNRSINSFFLWLLIANIILLFSTLLNHGNLFETFSYSYIMFSLVVLDFLCKGDFERYLSLTVKGLSIFVLLNFILMIFFPSGIYQTLQDRYDYIASIRMNLFGYDNQLSSVLVPYTGLTLCLYYMKHKVSILVYGGFFSMILTILISTSTTLKIIFALFFLMVIITQSRNTLFTFKFKFWLILLIVFFVVFIQKYEFLSFFITSVLGKSMTLSNRTYIWQEAFYLIKNHFLLGLGLTGSDNYIYLPLSDDFRSAHDMYLQLILRGGVLYFFSNLVAWYKAGIVRTDEFHKISISMLKISIVIMMIGMISEVLSLNIFYLVLFALILFKRREFTM